MRLLAVQTDLTSGFLLPKFCAISNFQAKLSRQIWRCYKFVIRLKSNQFNLVPTPFSFRQFDDEPHSNDCTVPYMLTCVLELQELRRLWEGSQHTHTHTTHTHTHTHTHTLSLSLPPSLAGQSCHNSPPPPPHKPEQAVFFFEKRKRKLFWCTGRGNYGGKALFKHVWLQPNSTKRQGKPSLGQSTNELQLCAWSSVTVTASPMTPAESKPVLAFMITVHRHDSAHVKRKILITILSVP